MRFKMCFLLQGIQVKDPDKPVTATHRNFFSRFADLNATRFLRAQLADLLHAHCPQVANGKSSVSARAKYPPAWLMKLYVKYSRNMLVRSRLGELDDRSEEHTSELQS